MGFNNAVCVDGKSPSDIDVVAGIHNLANPEIGYQQVSIAQIIIHPDYDPTTFDNDIALLNLSTPVQLGETTDGTTVSLIAPVASDVESLIGVTATVAGWGNRSGNSSNYPETLHQASIPIIDNATCEAWYNNAGVSINLTANMLCAGLEAGDKDACSGDRGGPLVFFDSASQSWRQVGLSSKGSSCGEPDQPGIYTRLSNYVDWIISQGVDLEEPIEQIANLSITKVGPALVTSGDLITYTITVSNRSLVAEATNLVITDVVPLNAHLVGVGVGDDILTTTGTVSRFEGDLVQITPAAISKWEINTLGPNSVLSVTLVVTSIEAISNNQYGVRADDEIITFGQAFVETQVVEPPVDEKTIYLPVIFSNIP